MYPLECLDNQGEVSNIQVGVSRVQHGVQAVSLAVIRYSCYKATRLDTITKGVSINRKELRGLRPGKLPRLIV